jgi:hypothetical protein
MKIASLQFTCGHSARSFSQIQPLKEVRCKEKIVGSKKGVTQGEYPQVLQTYAIRPTKQSPDALFLPGMNSNSSKI